MRGRRGSGVGVLVVGIAGSCDILFGGQCLLFDVTLLRTQLAGIRVVKRSSY